MISNLKNSMSRFNYEYFFTNPSYSKVMFFWLGLYLLVITSSAFFYLSSKKLSYLHLEFAKKLFWGNLSLSLVGLFLVFARFENVNLFSWRVWQFLVLLSLVSYNLYYFFIKRGHLLEALDKEKSRARKEKWLPNSKKRKKS